eukprot:TRINITY_DN28466_c0_g1_i1.p1 TRINITY_DN28466_c0_g1~~TRINITY_DN28466_c0_g1_i1.p1  ORF type:complete len:546 (+),score=131.97 TRINITY_DN28466_c0_g1_i1:48-1640(+)
MEQPKTAGTLGDNDLFTHSLMTVHFVRPLLCSVNYLAWVRDERDELGGTLVDAYLVLTVVALFAFFLGSSAFYAMSHRWPDPRIRAAKRISWGVLINLLLADIPLFVLEVDVAGNVGLENGMQTICLLLACASLGGSTFRTWLFCTTRYIQHDMTGKSQIPVVRRPASPHGSVAWSAIPRGSVYTTAGRPRDYLGASLLAPPLPEPPQAANNFYPKQFALARPGISLLCMLLWLVSIVCSLVNYAAYISTSDGRAEHGDSVANAYLAFMICGFVIYFTVGTTQWLWGWLYSTDAGRLRRTVIGISAMLFVHSGPLLALDVRAVDKGGVQKGTQMAALVFECAGFCVGACTVWLAYVYRVSADMHDGLCCSLPALDPPGTPSGAEVHALGDVDADRLDGGARSERRDSERGVVDRGSSLYIDDGELRQAFLEGRRSVSPTRETREVPRSWQPGGRQPQAVGVRGVEQPVFGIPPTPPQQQQSVAATPQSGSVGRGRRAHARLGMQSAPTSAGASPLVEATEARAEPEHGHR